MNRQRLSHGACLLAAVALKAAQRVCLPVLPPLPLTAARLTGEGLFLLVALAVGLGMAACCLHLDGRGFAGLYLRCAGLCLLCRLAGLLLWQLVGGHWVVVLYLSEVMPLLVCSWQINWAANGPKRGAESPGMGTHWHKHNAGTQATTNQTGTPADDTSRRNHLRLAVSPLTLLAILWVQVLTFQRCSLYVPNSPSYGYALRHLSFPIGAVEWLVLLVGCWLLLPTLPETWQHRRSIAMAALLVSGCLVMLGLLDGLLKPQGFLKGMGQSSQISTQSLNWGAAEPWQSETSRWTLRRRQGNGTEDHESLRFLSLRDAQGRTTDRLLLTEPLTEESFLLEGKPVQLLHPCGLLLPKGDTLQWIPFTDLPKQREHPLLTAFCHAHLTDFRLLPSVGGYLLRHAPEAIQPQLERYAVAAFTPEETAAMGDLNPAWIIRTARRLLP